MQSVNQQILDAFRFRHACKAFDQTRAISDADFDTILEAGRLSPSSFGFEPWKFVVVQDQALLERLLPVAWGAQKQFPSASHIVLLLARKMVDTQAGSGYVWHVIREVQNMPGELQQGRNERFASFQQNDFDLTDERKLFDWACKQTYIALGNMMTAAALLGIDSCPMEGFCRPELEEILAQAGVLDRGHFGVSVMAAFGYREPGAKPRPKTRGDARELIAWVK